MNVPKPGQTSTDSNLVGRRDAFHCTAVMVMSDDAVFPAELVRFTDEHCVRVVADARSPHAIVDPYLNMPVLSGTLFWVFPLPGLTDNLRHHFDLDLKVKVPRPAASAIETWCEGCPSNDDVEEVEEYGFGGTDECRNCDS